DPAAHKRFRGLPSPGAAGCIASLAILRGQLPERLVQALPDIDPAIAQQVMDRLVEVMAPVGAVLVALLMVSRIPYPHVTKQVLRGLKKVPAPRLDEVRPQ